MPPALIGITVHPAAAPDRAELDILLASIVQGVERAGGLPLLIPPGLGEGALRHVYERLDGLLLSGGGDIDPAQYGAETHASVGGVDADRDRTELTLVRWLAGDTRPLLGICRGMQVLNVALGGTLYRDVSEHPKALRHDYYPGFAYDLRPHPIEIEEGSRLLRVIGRPTIDVNSLHHQACRHVAPGLRAAAWAPDGLLEAIESRSHPFALGVQWHPECLPGAPETHRLFAAFVEAASALHTKLQT